MGRPSIQSEVDSPSPSPVMGAAEASAQAAGADARVEVVQSRTEDSALYANPDGTWTTEIASGPVRVRRADGSWAPIDTTLVTRGGRLVPRAAALPYSLSAGGDADLVAVAGTAPSGRRIGFGVGWPQRLQAPQLNGDTAVYQDAVWGLPGAKLRVRALPSGFSHDLILTRRPRIDSKVELRLPLRLWDATRVDVAGDDSISVSDDAGDRVISAPSPLMWDSRVDPVSRDPAVIKPVDVRIEDGTDSQVLVLTPDVGFLADPATRFPVTIDPTYGASTDTWVATNYPTSQIGSTELKAGTYNGGGTVARPFLQFNNTGSYAGQHVLDAQFRIFNHYSSSCKGAQVAVRRIDEPWDSREITWSSQPGTTSAGIATLASAWGYSSSCSGRLVSFDVTEIASYWAAHPTLNYGLRIKGTDETDSNTWRRYNSANWLKDATNASKEPTLSVTYNSYPNKPSSLTATPGTGGNITSTTPTLTAVVSDPDGGTARGYFEVYDSTGTRVWTGTGNSVTSGAASSVTMNSGLARWGTYTVRAWSDDGTDRSKTYASATLQVDVPPAGPAVSSSMYEDSAAVAFVDDSPTPDFSWTNPSARTGGFQIVKDGGAPASVPATTTSLFWYPEPGEHTLEVTAVSSQGFTTAAGSFGFSVAADATPDVPTHLLGAEADTRSPVLSAILTAPDDKAVTGRFYVADATGNLVGEFTSSSTESGHRAAARVPDLVLRAGEQYQWWANACQGQACSSPTSTSSLTIDPAPAPAPPTEDPPVSPPSAPRGLAVTAGDGGAAITWNPPESTGYEGGIDSYSVTATRPDGQVEATRTGQGMSAVLVGLANGVEYTVAVTATTPNGTSAASSATITPVAVPASAVGLADSVRAFWAGRNRIEVGDADTAAQALVGQPADIDATVRDAMSAQAPGLVAVRNLLAMHDETGYTAAQPSLSDTLLMPKVGGASVDVRATVGEVLTGTDSDGESEAEEGRFPLTFTFARDADGTYGLVSYHATAAETSVPSVATEAEIDAAVRSLDMSGAVETDAAGWPTESEDESETNAVEALSYQVNNEATASWAREHSDETHYCHPNCTCFASRALHYGGGMEFVRYNDTVQDNRNWFYDETWWTDSWTWSWSAANNLHQFLETREGLDRKNIYRAVPGDVVFYQGWNKNENRHDPIGHTAIVVDVKSKKKKLWVAQSQTNYSRRSLKKQISEYIADSGVAPLITVRHIA